jgi:hypothetical protein
MKGEANASWCLVAKVSAGVSSEMSAEPCAGESRDS